jgi:Ca2+-binding RTX toxin-like protein
VTRGYLQGATISADGTKAYTAFDDGSISAYDIASGALLGHWQVGSTLGGIDVTTDGRFLVAVEREMVTNGGPGWGSSSTIAVHRLDLATGQVQTFTTAATGYDGTFYDVATTSGGKVVLTQDFQGSGWVPLTTLDLDTGVFTRGSQVYAQAGVLSVSQDHSKILFGPQNISDAPLFIYTSGSGITDSRGGYQNNISGFNRGLQAITTTGNLAAQALGSQIYIFDAHLQFVTNLGQAHPELDSVAGLAFSANGASLYVLDSDSDRVFEFSTANWSITRAIPINFDLQTTAAAYGDRLSMSADGHYMFVLGETYFQKIDLIQVLSDGPTDGADQITGTAAADTLYGFAGNDRLDGGAGSDTMRGGAGDDVYVVDSIYDSVVEANNAGNDTVVTSVSMTLPYSVEALVGAGSAAISLTGDARTNSLTGNSGDNIITGGARSDTLTGGGGADRFVYGAVADSESFDYDFITDFTTGSDQLDLRGVTPTEVSLVSSGAATFVFVNAPGGPMTIAANGQVNGSDVLTHDGHGVYMIGDGAANTLVGGSTGDVIQSGAGDDVIVGGGGGDVIFGQAGADTIKYLSVLDSNADGSDGLFVFETGVDKVDLSAVHPSEVSLIRSGGSTFLFASTPQGAMQLATVGYDLNGRDVITGDGHGFYMIGDSVADTLIGGATGDVIQANGGDDIVIGGGGGDAIWGGAGADVFKYLAASDSNSAGTDTIFDFQSGVDKIDLSALRTGASDTLGIVNSGGSTFLFIDLHGDGVGDMTIQLNGTASITTSDYLF